MTPIPAQPAKERLTTRKAAHRACWKREHWLRLDHLVAQLHDAVLPDGRVGEPQVLGRVRRAEERESASQHHRDDAEEVSGDEASRPKGRQEARSAQEARSRNAALVQLS